MMKLKGSELNSLLSFGKQSKSQTPLEVIHNATRRTTAASDNKPPASNKTTAAFPSLSSSSQDWINSFRKSNPRNSSANENGDKFVGPPNHQESPEEEDERTIGPPPGSDGAGGEDEDPQIGPPRPPSGNAEDVDDDDEPVIGPPRPPPGSINSDSDEDEEYDDSGYRLPLSNEIVLKGHTKVVSALAIDHSGSRVLSGSYDYTVRMYDFQGMNAHLQSSNSRGVELESYSRSIFVCHWISPPRLRSMTAMDLHWVSLSRETCISEILRILKATSCSFLATLLQIWSIKDGCRSRPDIHVEECHTDDITSLKFSSDGLILLSRSFDGSLKVWDLSQMKKALRVF